MVEVAEAEIMVGGGGGCVKGCDYHRAYTNRVGTLLCMMLGYAW